MSNLLLDLLLKLKEKYKYLSARGSERDLRIDTGDIYYDVIMNCYPSFSNYLQINWKKEGKGSELFMYRDIDYMIKKYKEFYDNKSNLY